MLKGIGCKIASAFCFTVMAALIRWIGPSVPLGEVVFARSAFALLPIVVWLALRGEIADAVRTPRPGGHFVRSIVGVTAMFCSFKGLSLLPLPDATMLGYASPLMVVILAAIILREPFRAARLLAVIVGLAGVLVMLWPHLSDGDLARALSGEDAISQTSRGAFFALGGAFFTACAMIQIRRLVQTETTAAIVFYFSLLCSVAGLVTAPFGWVMPEPKFAVALVAIGIIGGIGQILMTESYRSVEASTIAPLEYTTIVWSIGIGWMAFGDLPDIFALLGGVIVIASGFLVIYYERRLGIERAKARRAAIPPS